MERDHAICYAAQYEHREERTTVGRRRSEARDLMNKLFLLSTKAALVLCTFLVASAAGSQQTVAPPSTKPGEGVGRISDALPSLRRDAQCMVNVLGNTPRTDHVRSGVSQSDGHPEVFVEYRYHEGNGEYHVVRFVADEFANSKNSIYFLTYLSGLMTPGSPGPPDFGTAKVTRLWKLKCHVRAYIDFE